MNLNFRLKIGIIAWHIKTIALHFIRCDAIHYIEVLDAHISFDFGDIYSNQSIFFGIIWMFLYNPLN